MYTPNLVCCENNFAEHYVDKSAELSCVATLSTRSHNKTW